MTDTSTHFHTLPLFVLPMVLRSFDFLQNGSVEVKNYSSHVRAHAQESHTFTTYSHFHTSKIIKG